MSSRPDTAGAARSKHSYLTIDHHNTVGSFHSVVAWIECNWLHGRWGAVKVFIPGLIASQYRRFISFRCGLEYFSFMSYIM